jgi:hypothetical protein
MDYADIRRCQIRDLKNKARILRATADQREAFANRHPDWRYTPRVRELAAADRLTAEECETSAACAARAGWV